eukprot:3302900-Pyramimonas_sp.AAC.2
MEFPEDTLCPFTTSEVDPSLGRIRQGSKPAGTAQHSQYSTAQPVQHITASTAQYSQYSTVYATSQKTPEGSDIVTSARIVRVDGAAQTARECRLDMSRRRQNFRIASSEEWQWERGFGLINMA